MLTAIFIIVLALVFVKSNIIIHSSEQTLSNDTRLAPEPAWLSLIQPTAQTSRFTVHTNGRSLFTKPWAMSSTETWEKEIEIDKIKRNKHLQIANKQTEVSKKLFETSIKKILLEVYIEENYRWIRMWKWG